MIKKFANYFVNRKVPVKSVTLNLPRQKRFRITYTGKILDLHNMKDDEIESYLNDEEEKNRQQAPGFRHRNRETIKCRYSYITSEDKIKASLERIKKDKNTGDDFKFLKFQTLNKTRKSQRPIIVENRVEDLKIYESVSLVDDVLKSNKTKKSKKKQMDNPKYSGPKYNLDDQDDADEFKEVPLQNNDKTDSFKFNEEKIIILHLHGMYFRIYFLNSLIRQFDIKGGALFTQGPQGAELYLRSIVNSLGGVPILAVDYSLTGNYFKFKCF